MKLSMLKPGEMGKIIKIGTLGLSKRRLMDMGVLPGEIITIEKVAPLGDPVEISVKNCFLSIKKRSNGDRCGGL